MKGNIKCTKCNSEHIQIATVFTTRSVYHQTPDGKILEITTDPFPMETDYEYYLCLTCKNKFDYRDILEKEDKE